MKKISKLLFLVGIILFLLSACSTMQFTSNRLSDGVNQIKVLYSYPKANYVSLGVIDYDYYQPGFRQPTVSDALPDLKRKVKSVGGNALIIRNQRNDYASFGGTRRIVISAEVLKVNWNTKKYSYTH